MKKKLLYLTSILLFASASSNAQSVLRSWIFPSPTAVAGPGTPFVSPGSAFLSTTVVEGLTLEPGGPSITTFGVCDASVLTFTDGFSATGRIKFGGAGISVPAPGTPLTQADYLSPTANFMPNQRYLSFPVAAGTTTVKVWFKTSSNGSARSVICTNGVNWKVFTTTIGSVPGPAVDAAILEGTYTANAAGTLYLYSDIGANIYKIEVNGPDPTLAVNNFKKESSIVVSARKGIVNLSNVKSSTKVSVFNILGSLVKSIETSSDTTLDIRSGVYIVKTKSIDGEKSVKVIVQ